QEDLAFAEARQKQLKVINQQKKTMRRQASRRVPVDQDSWVERYALLLEKEQLVQSQPLPGLAHLSAEKRQSYQRRRDFWEKSRQRGLKTFAGEKLGYFAITGESIGRIDANQFRAENAFATPCLCEEGEKPAW